MSDAVWVSRGSGNSDLKLGFKGDAWTWSRERRQLLTTPHRGGLWGSPELFPKYFRSEKRKTLPDFFFASVCLVVSERVANVLSQFDLGREIVLVPVDVFKPDGKTPMGGQYYCLNFGAQKDTVAAANVKGTAYVYDPRDPYLPPGGTIKDDYIAVTRMALEGADLWTDPAANGDIFVSDRLYSALKAQKLDKAFTFYRCRVERSVIVMAIQEIASKNHLQILCGDFS
jgi:hypothetical protein